MIKHAKLALVVLGLTVTAVGNAWADEAQDLVSQGDALIEKLGEGDPKGAIEKYEAALEAGADEYEVSWKIARAYFWWSDWQDDGATKKKLGLKGMEAASKAIELQPDRVEGQYFYAINVGEYSKGISIVRALAQGMEPKFKDAAEKAAEIDPGFDNGGPYNALGRFYYELPWPKRKLSKSEELLKKNIEAHPGNFRARYYLVETLLEQKSKKAAREQLNYMVNNEPAEHNLADGKRYQREAKKLLDELK